MRMGVLHQFIQSCVLGLLATCGATSVASQAATVPISAAGTHRTRLNIGAITASSISPASDAVAFGGLNVIDIVRASDLRPVLKITGLPGRVTSLNYSVDGKLLFASGGTAGVSGEVRVFDAIHGRLLCRLMGASDIIQSAAIDRAGRHVIGASYDHNVYYWSIGVISAKAGVPVLLPTRELKDHTDAVYAADISADGKIGVSAAGDRTVKVWDLLTGKRKITLSDSTGDLAAVVIRPGGKEVAAAGMDRILRVWDVATGKLLHTTFAHDAGVLALRYTHDGTRLISAGEDRTIKLWRSDNLADAGTSEFRLQGAVPSDWPHTIAIDKLDRYVAAGCHDGTVLVTPLHPVATSVAKARPVDSGLMDEQVIPAASACAVPVDDVVVSQLPQSRSAKTAQPLTIPSVITGVLTTDTTDVANYYRFHARKGERIMAVVNARRAGSALDSYLQILELDGKPVERAVLRSVSQSEITLFDKDSTATGIRLLPFPDLQLNDYVMIGREILQVGALAKGVDDDTQFRAYRGQRQGQLGTTPEYHTIGSKVYRVEAHAAGSKFAPNGMPLVHLNYENDDGGPLYGRDSVIDFTAPHEGDYLVRISDAQGRQGKAYTYRLEVHAPRPDYSVTINPQVITLPAGYSVPVSVQIERLEGFNSPVQIRLSGLSPEFQATETVIQEWETSATILVSSVGSALGVSSTYRLETSSETDALHIGQNLDVATTRKLVVGAAPSIEMKTTTPSATIAPGGRCTLHVSIVRKKGFAGRVPVDVVNLPAGVRVADVGLNGILIPENQTERDIVLECQPWVTAQVRQIGIQLSAEGGTGGTLPPVALTVKPDK